MPFWVCFLSREVEPSSQRKFYIGGAGFGVERPEFKRNRSSENPSAHEYYQHRLSSQMPVLFPQFLLDGYFQKIRVPIIYRQCTVIPLSAGVPKRAC